MTSPSLVRTVRRFLSAQAPFSEMAHADVEFVAQRLELAYFAAGELIIGPDAGPPPCCWVIRQGAVDGLRPDPANPEAPAQAVLHLTPGEIFPVGALMAKRAVSSTYRANGDCFCWRLSLADFEELTRRSPVFVDFCRRRLAALLDLSRQAMQATFAAQATQWRSVNQSLAQLARGPVLTCPENTSLEDVFERMEARNVGSIIVTDEAEGALLAIKGIFTRQDVIGRVVLPRLPLDTPVSQVMSAPVVTALASDTAADAMLKMADRGIRHLPVIDDQGLAGVVTERDLFVLQRRSLRQIGDAIRLATETGQLQRAAQDIREWSYSLVAQGASADFVTRLISRLNDQLTQRLLRLTAREQGLEMQGVCWLALGSEGREEQTIATDQDNGLLIAPDCPLPRDTLLLYAQAVNAGLDACGYPKCRGEIMAGNPRWCLTRAEWLDLFERWIERGDPSSLLNASIFFDFRGLAGDLALAADLRARVTRMARANPRFLKQMSDNALRNRPPQGWTGGLLEQVFSAEVLDIDLKLQGATPFVDAARVLALANGVESTGTAERLMALARDQLLPMQEVNAWIDAFQFVQSLRLRVQQHSSPIESANRLAVKTLSELDRRILKEAFRQARKLQQRLAADYPG